MIYAGFPLPTAPPRRRAMKRPLPAILALLLALLAAAPLCAQEDEPEPEDNTDLDSLEAALSAQERPPAAPAAAPPPPAIKPGAWEGWWRKSLDYQRQDSTEQALACADSAVSGAWLSDLRLPVQSGYWLSLSDRALATGDRTLAARYASLALDIDDASVPAMLAGFRAGLAAQGPRRALGELAARLAAAARDFGVQLRYGSQLLVWACLVLLLWGLIYGLYLAAARLAGLIHAAAELLPRALSPGARTALAAGLAAGLAAALAWVSLPLAILLAAAVCAVQATARERAFLFVSLALVTLAAIGLSLGRHLFSRIDDEYLVTLNRANHAPFDAALYDRLAAYQTDDGRDLMPPFAMALLDKRAGRFQRAEAILSAMTEASPNAGAANNLGNLYFLRGSQDTAAACYRQALQWDPSLALAHYNLAQVHLRRLEFGPAKQEQERAVQLDLAGIESRASRYGNGVPMDQLLDGRLLWHRLMAGWNPLRGFSPRETVTLAGLPLWLPPPAALALLLLMIAWLRLTRGRLRRDDCVTCGAPVCRACLTATLAGEHLCKPCADKIGLATAPALQQELAARLSARKRRRTVLRSALASLLVPGSSLAMAGRTVGAWLLALGWAAVLVVMIAAGVGLPAGQLAAALAGKGLLWWIAGSGGLLLAVSWLGFLIHIAGAPEPAAGLPRTKAAGEAQEGDEHAA